MKPFDVLPLDAEDDGEVIDFSLVHADDAWIEDLGSVEGPDPWVIRRDELAEVLLSWRRDVDAVPIPDLMSQKQAVAVVEAAGAAWVAQQMGCA